MTADVFTFSSDDGDSHGYLIVRNGRSILIDCPSADLAAKIQAQGLPLPEAILHTQVQEEHCREHACLGRAAVHVYDQSEDVARRSEQFFADCKTAWPPDRTWRPEDRGYEKYGVAGATTERPPKQPLNVQGTLRAGETFRWQDVELEVLALPGSGKRAIGLYWRTEGLLFSGDLMRAGGFLVNFYDIERAYGPYIGWREMIRSLDTVIALAPRRALPTTGPAIEDPAADAKSLIDRIRKGLSPHYRGAARPLPVRPMRTFGRWRQHAEGLYQCHTDGGPMVLYVDRQGRGLCVDPDICVWHDWDTNCRLMHESLDLLEKEAGLKRIEWTLITHYHGDHMEYAPLLKERYGTEILAPADVAVLLERPEEFPYVAPLHWFGFPYKTLTVDRRLAYDQTVDWNGVPISTIRLPGHCWAHAGYILPWAGMKTVCTGDSLQYGGGPIVMFLPVLYSDTAWPERGWNRTYEKLRDLKPDLVLGGHSTYFYDPDGAILKDWVDASEESIALAQTLLHDGNLMRAMTPPGYDEARRRLPFWDVK